nr:uncharacterized protein LOC116276618 [Vicugna pacos]
MNSDRSKEAVGPGGFQIMADHSSVVLNPHFTPTRRFWAPGGRVTSPQGLKAELRVRGSGQEAGKGQARWREQHRQSLSRGTCICPARDLKGGRLGTDTSPKQRAVGTSLTGVEKRGNPSREFCFKLRNHQPECQGVEGESGCPGDPLPTDWLETWPGGTVSGPDIVHPGPAPTRSFRRRDLDTLPISLPQPAPSGSPRGPAEAPRVSGKFFRVTLKTLLSIRMNIRSSRFSFYWLSHLAEREPTSNPSKQRMLGPLRHQPLLRPTMVSRGNSGWKPAGCLLTSPQPLQPTPPPHQPCCPLSGIRMGKHRTLALERQGSPTARHVNDGVTALLLCCEPTLCPRGAPPQ